MEFSSLQGMLSFLTVPLFIITIYLLARALQFKALAMLLRKASVLLSNYVPMVVIYLANMDKISWHYLLDPPLFYDHLLGLQIVSPWISVFGIVLFMASLWLTYFFFVLGYRNRCITKSGEDLEKCLQSFHNAPSLWTSYIFAYFVTVILGLMLPNFHAFLYSINPLLPFVPAAVAVLLIVLLIVRASRPSLVWYPE